jgi:hypothetical protein
MRILRFFFFSLIGVLVLGFLSFFFGREILLVWGSTMLRTDYEFLLKKGYGNECARQFSYGQDYWTQIRFTSNKNYNLEVVCEDFTSSPIVVATKKLPPLLFKKSSGGGFIIDDRELPSFIELSSMGRKLFIYTDQKTLHSNYLSKPDLDYDNGPLTSCQAHNYQCCSLDLQSGLGNQTTSVTDCPKSCYESCLLRPSVLSFNTRPSPDEKIRTVEVNSGEVITFSYVLGNGKGDVFKGQLSKNEKTSILEQLQTVFYKQQAGQKDNEIALPLEVSVDLGDGEMFQGTNSQDTFDHTYTCQTTVCYFQAKISIKDARGVLSVDNELAKMIIKVNTL